MSTRFAAAWRRLAMIDVEREDVMIVLGLLLLGGGIAMYARPAALIVVGALLLWMFVPARPPFVERSPTTRSPGTSERGRT